MGKLRRIVLLFATMPTFLLASDSDAFNKPAILEALRVNLSGTTSLMYFSNPYLLDSSAPGGGEIPETFGTTFTPAATVELGTPSSRFYFKGEADYSIRDMFSIDDLNARDSSYTIDFRRSYNRLNWRAGAQSSEFSLPNHNSRLRQFIPKGTNASQFLNLSYQYWTRTLLKTGVRFNGKSYDRSEGATYSDQSSYSIPIQALYRISEDIDLGFGSLYRERKSGVRPTIKEYALHANLKGKLTPRITADVKVGNLNSTPQSGSEFPITSSADSLFLSAQIAWEATRSMRFFFEASSDKQANAFGEDINTDSLSTTLQWQPKRQTTLSAKIKKVTDQYQTSKREEDRLELEMNVTHSLSETQQLTFHLNRTLNDSTAFGYDYQSTFTSTSWDFRF